MTKENKKDFYIAGQHGAEWPNYKLPLFLFFPFGTESCVLLDAKMKEE